MSRAPEVPSRRAGAHGAEVAGSLPEDRPLTVLLVHNRYRERGGEDAVYEAEGRLLEARGHRVIRHEVHNEAVDEHSPLRLVAGTVWNAKSHAAVGRLARASRPDLAHVHNTLPLLSPAVHHALWAAGAAVVQTLHNYRLLCPQGMLLREGRPCEDCVGRTPPWPAVRHACYRGSRAASAAVAAMLTTHRGLGTWERRVDAFVALTGFARSRFLAGGLPPDRVHVKAPFVDPDPGVGPHDGGFLLFVGRLAPEKGLTTLLEAWRQVVARPRAGVEPRLVVVGDGPLGGQIRAAAAALPGLEWEGRGSRERVLDLMGRARALVFPSLCYENFPGVIAEAYARGLPVLGSRLGSTAELVREGETGALFEAGNPTELAVALRWALRPEADLARLGRAARAVYEERHTAEAGYRGLRQVYAAALARRARRAAGSPTES